MQSNDDLSRLQTQVKVARDEIKNLRKSIEGLKRVHKKDKDEILGILANYRVSISNGLEVGHRDFVKPDFVTPDHVNDDILECLRHVRPIGTFSSVFTDKNGTPRQPVVAESRGTLTIDREIFNNPSHSLIGLEKYSHVWVIFVFHKNSTSSSSSSSSASTSSSSSSSSSSASFTKAKVHPPRLGGASVGVFACRSPHRPNPIGLTLCKIENIRDNVVELSAIDLIDGTPVLDLKPYISDYDQPASKKKKIQEQPEDDGNLTLDDSSENAGVKGDDTELNNSLADPSTSSVADWLRVANDETPKYSVFFTPSALKGLKEAFPQIPSDARKPETVEELKRLVENVLREDPRSVYRKNKCREMLYYSTVSGIHVTSWFDDDDKVVTVLKISNVVA